MFSKYNTTSVISGSIWTNGFVTWSAFYHFIGHYKTINIYARFSKYKIFLFKLIKTLRQDRVTILIKINNFVTFIHLTHVIMLIPGTQQWGLSNLYQLIHYFFISVHRLFYYSDDSKFGFFPYFQFLLT